MKRAGLAEGDVMRLIEERTQARINKEFSKSDKIRADLTAKGIALMDLGKETIWRPCIPAEPLMVEEDQPDKRAPIAEEKQVTPPVNQKVEEQPVHPEGSQMDKSL